MCSASAGIDVSKDSSLELCSVSKSFKTNSGVVAIVENFSCMFKKGLISALMGPSGIGKSTLLRLAAGIETPERGSVLYEGKNVTGTTSVQRMLIPQELGLFDWLTVRANITLADHSIGKKAVLGECDELIEQLGLSGVEQMYPPQLSGGMKQRVALARALYVKPQLLLMDEPYSSVDSLTKRKLYQMLFELKEKYEVTVLLVTHDVHEAAVLADEVILVGDKRPLREAERKVSPLIGEYGKRADFYYDDKEGFKQSIDVSLRV